MIWRWSSEMIRMEEGLATAKEGKNSPFLFTPRESMEEEKITFNYEVTFSHVSWCFGSKVLPFALVSTFLGENSEFTKQ